MTLNISLYGAGMHPERRRNRLKVLPINRQQFTHHDRTRLVALRGDALDLAPVGHIRLVLSVVIQNRSATGITTTCKVCYTINTLSIVPILRTVNMRQVRKRMVNLLYQSSAQLAYDRNAPNSTRQERMPIHGDRLKARRTALGLSQADVAKDIGIKTYQQYDDWERERHSPPIKYLEGLSRA